MLQEIITYCITLSYLDIPINVIRKLSMNIEDKQINNPDNHLLQVQLTMLYVWVID